MEQKVLDRLTNALRRDYSEIFQFLEIVSSIENLDLNELEQAIIFDISNDDLSLLTGYEYSDKYNPEFINEINSNVETFTSNNTLRYLTVNNAPEEEINKHIVEVFRGLMYDEEEVREVVSEFKSSMQERNLFDSTVETIKKSRNIDAIITTGLVYDESIIDEFFGNKLNLYYYILDSKEITDEEVNFYRDYIYTMNNNEVGNQIEAKIKKIENKINNY